MSNIVLETGKIIGNTQITGQQFTNKLRVVSQLTPQVAELMGVRYTLFQKDGVIRFGAKAVELEVEYENAWFIHEIDKVARLELPGVSVGKFKAFRVGDGKKKPKKMMISFQVIHVGNPFPLTEHLMKVMRGVGRATIKPTEEQQTGMFSAEVVPDEKLAAEQAAKGWPTPDGNGHYNAKPIAKYKSNDKKWTASLFTLELATGWTMAFSCTWGTGKQEIPLVESSEPFSSETEAISWAANLIIQEMRDKCEKGSAVSKREARKMRDWAAKYVQAQTVMETAAKK